MNARTSKPAKPSPSAGRKRIEFSIEAASNANVSVAGSFNNWLPLALTTKAKGKAVRFSRVVFLPPGRYEYKFIINDEWTTDPLCADSVINEHGTQNSCLQIATA